MSFASSKSKPPSIPKDQLVKRTTEPRPPSIAKPGLQATLRQALRAQDGRPSSPRAMRDAVSRLTNPQTAATAERITDIYEIIEPLHTSALSTELQLALHRRTGEVVVLKAIDRAKMQSGTRVAPAAAAVYHAQIDHPHICALHEIFDSTRLVLALEYVPGITLDRFMIEYGCGEPEARQIAQQLGSALAHIHGAGVCHRAVSLQNVMLREGPRCCVKLIDFGGAATALKPLRRRVPTPGAPATRTPPESALKPLRRRVPTPGVYASPELIAAPDVDDTGPGYDGPLVDAWAYGVVLHMLLSGKFPFVTAEQACAGLAATLPETIPVAAAEVLRGLLAVPVEARTSVTDACAKDYLREEAEREMKEREAKAKAVPAVSGAGAPAPLAAVIATGTPAAWLRARAAGVLPSDQQQAHAEILSELESLGFDPSLVLRSLQDGVRNDATTSYFLLCRRRVRVAEEAEADTLEEEEGEAPSSPRVEIGTPRGAPPVPAPQAAVPATEPAAGAASQPSPPAAPELLPTAEGQEPNE